MKLLQKYYNWRASKAKTATGQAHWRTKAYNLMPLKWGLNLNQFPDPQAMKEELTSDIGQKPVNEDAMRVNGGQWPHKPGRYAEGPINVWTDEGGNLHDDTIWKETPQWWADVPEANQQHQPTYRTPRAHATFTKFDPATGKRTYWKYNYKTGQQEEVK